MCILITDFAYVRCLNVKDVMLGMIFHRNVLSSTQYLLNIGPFKNRLNLKNLTSWWLYLSILTNCDGEYFM